MKQHVVSVILTILCIFLVVQNNNLKKDNKQLGIALDDVEQTVIDLKSENEELLVREEKVSGSLGSNDEENNGNNINVIESAVNDFLKAFYTYDSQTNVKEQVQPHVTDSFLSKVKLQEVTKTTVKYYSNFIKSEVYYSDNVNNVFVRVWNEITIQGQSSEKQTFLQLKLLETNGAYLVDDMEIQGNLDAEGYLDS